uniref:Uncharacterized protein n=1 Tax=Brassica oleracea var. oleracea TaxID=109376 RepID=A0A0D3BV89_BRAOL
MIHVLQMSFLIIRLESILEEVNKVGDMGVVHILVADEGVVCIDPVEVHELMLEVVHEKVVKNNHLRQQYKTLLLVLEIINDKVYNNFFMDDYDEWKNAEALFLGLQVPKHTKFYWKCLNTFKELNFWHNGEHHKFAQWGYTAKCTTVRHHQIHNNGVYSLAFNTGEHCQMLNSRSHHQMHNNGANHQFLNSGAHRQMHNDRRHRQLHKNGAYRRMLNNGAHHQMLSSGVHNQMFNNGTHHQVINNGDIKDQILEITNQRERIQLIFSIDFPWAIIMKFQIAQKRNFA